MGFLKRGVDESEADPGPQNEELYEKLFPKIGRDFVYIEDFEEIISVILSIVDPAGLNPFVNPRSNEKAKQKALEYKRLLDSGKDGSKKYQDLINLDDD